MNHSICIGLSLLPWKAISFKRSSGLASRQTKKQFQEGHSKTDSSAQYCFQDYVEMRHEPCRTRFEAHAAFGSKERALLLRGLHQVDAGPPVNAGLCADQ